MSRASILVVDDQPAMVDLIIADLEEIGFSARGCHDAEQALSALEEHEFDVVVTDLRMPGRSGLDLCRQLVQEHPATPVIVMTAFGTVAGAVEAMQAGAQDFVTKPFEIARLKLAIDKAVSHERLRREASSLRYEQSGESTFEGIHGAAPAMRKLFDLVERVAVTDAPVLIQGESGTGKELLARAIHHRSLRAHASFVAVNCSAIPHDMLESELFGHERGAFTGATAARVGLVRQAHRGTLLLDEIGDMPLDLQPKILRVLQEGRVRPVGSDREHAVDVRVVSATHQDLEDAVRSGRFRQDLYFRLAVIRAKIPPLRERGGDILDLAHHFLDEVSDRVGRPSPLRLGERAEARLTSYSWPGNVRELRNWIEHAVVVCTDQEVTVDCFPQPLELGRSDSEHGIRVRELGHAPHGSHGGEISGSDSLESLAEIEHRHVTRVLEAVGGNKSRAAKILGIDRKTLLARLARYAKRQDA